MATIREELADEFRKEGSYGLRLVWFFKNLAGAATFLAMDALEADFDGFRLMHIDNLDETIAEPRNAAQPGESLSLEAGQLLMGIGGAGSDFFRSAVMMMRFSGFWNFLMADEWEPEYDGDGRCVNCYWDSDYMLDALERWGKAE